MGKTSIEWADFTHNPWEGCTKVSPGCANCYAEARNHRFGLDNWGNGKPRRRTSAENWKLPLKWNRHADDWRECILCGWRGPHTGICPCPNPNCSGEPIHMPNVRPRVFCASLADWLDGEVPIEWLADLLKLIYDTPHLDWLLLSKRLENWYSRVSQVYEANRGMNFSWMLRNWLQDKPPANVWMGTTVEDQQRANERIPELLKIPAKVRFLSCEPLLSEVHLRTIRIGTPKATLAGTNEIIEDHQAGGIYKDALTGEVYHPYGNDFAAKCGTEKIHWVICGGESGAGARPMHPLWAQGLRDQCQAAGVPFFFKQWGEWFPIQSGVMGTTCKPPRYQTHNDGKSMTVFQRLGKKNAGRDLDGREWNEFPGVGL